MGEAPSRRRLATGGQPACRSQRQKLVFHPGVVGEWVLVWTSTERGEGRSFAGLSLVLAPGAPGPGGVPTTTATLVVREASRWSAHRQPRALPRGHVRRRGGRQAHYGNSLDLASGTFATNLILLFIFT